MAERGGDDNDDGDASFLVHLRFMEPFEEFLSQERENDGSRAHL